jgi:hypothetical protein
VWICIAVPETLKNAPQIYGFSPTEKDRDERSNQIVRINHVQVNENFGRSDVIMKNSLEETQQYPVVTTWSEFLKYGIQGGAEKTEE